MPGLLLDLSHTSHTSARTGIQRVARGLWQHLEGELTPLTHDPFLGSWRPCATQEISQLESQKISPKRRAQWPLHARWRGRFHRLMGHASTHGLTGTFTSLIEPELFDANTARALPELFPHVHGPCVAIFHDAIALRYPELTPAATVARFPNYLRELLMFDGIAANSVESRDSLLGYWQWLGVTQTPPVVAIPLGVDPIGKLVEPAPAERTPVVLCVGTLEGRKNHSALLEACEQLWIAGHRFELRLIGRMNLATGGAALRRLRGLQAAGRSVRYDGPVSEKTLESAYAACAFTVYPSIAEGFGLPVIESLARGHPCVCSAHGAIGESAREGGCLRLDAVDAASLATAIARLLSSPTELAMLSAAAQARTFKTWADYARELQAWMHTLPRR